jgi:hypothetical protein
MNAATFEFTALTWRRRVLFTPRVDVSASVPQNLNPGRKLGVRRTMQGRGFPCRLLC